MAKSKHNHDQEIESAFQANLSGMQPALQGMRGGEEQPMGLAAPEGMSLGCFWCTAYEYVAAAVRMGIDTPEERQAILRSIMALFDKHVASRLGRYAAAVRSSVETTITNLLNAAGG